VTNASKSGSAHASLRLDDSFDDTDNEMMEKRMQSPILDLDDCEPTLGADVDHIFPTPDEARISQIFGLCPGYGNQLPPRKAVKH
jgi:hypothetical protein